MLKRAIFVLAAAASVGAPEPAAAQCLPFETGAVCRRPAKPQFIVDFGAKEFKAAHPLPRRSPPPDASRTRFSHRPQAIDCLMPPTGDATLDAGRVTSTTATPHRLRIAETPGCTGR